MIEIRITADSMQQLESQATHLLRAIASQSLEQADPAPAAAPQRRGRKPKAVEAAPVEEPMTGGTPPVGAVLIPHSAAAGNPGTPTPAVEIMQQVPAPVAVVKATQKDLIAAFRALANAKGTDPIVALLKKYGAPSVATIPEAQWGAAIIDAQAATK